MTASRRWSLSMTGVRLIDLPDIGAVTDDAEIVGSKTTSGHFKGSALKAYLSASVGGVASFNARTGDVSLTAGDVTAALGYVPSASGGGGSTTPSDLAPLID